MNVSVPAFLPLFPSFPPIPVWSVASWPLQRSPSSLHCPSYPVYLHVLLSGCSLRSSSGRERDSYQGPRCVVLELGTGRINVPNKGSQRSNSGESHYKQQIQRVTEQQLCDQTPVHGDRRKFRNKRKALREQLCSGWVVDKMRYLQGRSS